MSMFREHWLGGLTAYSVFFILSLITTLTVSIFYGSPFDWNPTITLNPLEIVGCFVIALLFGLWPDVDITSKSQKIFYGVLFVVNFSLILFLRRVFGVSNYRIACNASHSKQTSRMDAFKNNNDIIADVVYVGSNLYRIF